MGIKSLFVKFSWILLLFFVKGNNIAIELQIFWLPEIASETCVTVVCDRYRRKRRYGHKMGFEKTEPAMLWKCSAV